MSDPYRTFEQYVDQIGEDKDRLHQFVNGTYTEDVSTEGGPIPTLAKMLKSVSDAGGLAMYPDTATALAATSEGTYFKTPAGSDAAAEIIYLHDTGGVATEIAITPNIVTVEILVEASENRMLALIQSLHGDLGTLRLDFINQSYAVGNA